MLNDIRVLSARRAYEFRVDDLRLTALTAKPVYDLIQQVFSFQAAQVATPLATFGEVSRTIPPGLVFNYGLWTSNEGQSVPIRLLHVEQKRIVIDVAGPSSAITPIYERLRLVVSDVAQALKLLGDSPIVGEPERTKDYSEITAKCSWHLDALLAPGIRALLAQAAGMPPQDQNAMLALSLFAQPQSIGEESAGTIITADNRVLQFGPRLGTRPEDQVHFSGALLDSDEHIKYLQALDSALGE